MSVGEFEEPIEPIRPELWNPNAAANWSLLFTPAFGAYLHARNWRTLGNPSRALVNLVWVGVTIVFLIVNLGTLFLPDSKGIDGVMRAVGLGLLLGWYFTQGRGQAQYVKDTLGDDYVKKGWGGPLLAGLLGISAYVGLCFLVAFALYTPDPKDIAEEIKPAILQEWHKQPGLQNATIQNITLTHKGGNEYTGFVDATLGGQVQRLSLEVVVESGNMRWEVKPLTGK